MAYPNIPGRLPRSPYTDTSAKSMSIASPRAGHVDTSPHTQAPYTQLADPIGSRRLPSDLYSGMPSTQNLSPYNDTCLSPHDLRMPIHHTVDRSTGELVYPSNHTDMRRSQHGHVNTSSRALQRDYKMPVEQSVMERADRSSQGDHMSMFGLREMQPDITGDNKDIQIGAEDADSDSEWDDMDAFNREYPPSVRLHLKAILDEKKDAVSAAPGMSSAVWTCLPSDLCTQRPRQCFEGSSQNIRKTHC
ncbi:hypothetical protein DENSPDRAFT_843477 [Dentipellis sp. KUC8613]|nr:hypothetical protein DENSPDRAFT_843477 [Dentipellis sp. KUC8613]